MKKRVVAFTVGALFGAAVGFVVSSNESRIVSNRPPGEVLQPQPGGTVKRVIGLPGDRVEVRGRNCVCQWQEARRIVQVSHTLSCEGAWNLARRKARPSCSLR